MKRSVLWLCCLALIPSIAQAGELYRWVDGGGKVYYGDAPPPDAALVEYMKFPDAEMPDADLPYATRRAQQSFPVTLYVADNCAEYCDQARNLLVKRGIPFIEKTLSTREELDAFRALSGSTSVPTLGVGRNFLKGFLAGQWHNELDIAGYPAVAPYRAPAIPPVAAPAVTDQTAPGNSGSTGETPSQNEIAPDAAPAQ